MRQLASPTLSQLLRFLPSNSVTQPAFPWAEASCASVTAPSPATAIARAIIECLMFLSFVMPRYRFKSAAIVVNFHDHSKGRRSSEAAEAFENRNLGMVHRRGCTGLRAA